MRPKILAFDLGRLYGWARYEGEDFPLESGHGTLGSASETTMAEKLHTLRYVIRGHLNRVEYDYVAYENMVVGKFPQVLKAFGGYEGILICEAQAYQVGVLPIAPSTVRKRVMGHGGMNKKQAHAWMKEHGHTAETEDEMDARAVLLAAEQILSDHAALPKRKRGQK